jgi:hypothetical protein
MNHQIRFAAILFATFISCSSGYSQNLQVGIKGGFSNYQGDLQDKRLSLKRQLASDCVTIFLLALLPALFLPMQNWQRPIPTTGALLYKQET